MRNNVSDTTFEGQILKPKFIGRDLERNGKSSEVVETRNWGPNRREILERQERPRELGACIYDVWPERKHGGSQKADTRNKISRFLSLTRGEGVKKSENIADVICACP